MFACADVCIHDIEREREKKCKKERKTCFILSPVSTTYWYTFITIFASEVLKI